MELEEAKTLLDICERSEFRDHAFGDREVSWMFDGEEVASGYFGGGTADVWIHRLGTQVSIAAFMDDDARELGKHGKLKQVERNDMQGDDIPSYRGAQTMYYSTPFVCSDGHITNITDVANISATMYCAREFSGEFCGKSMRECRSLREFKSIRDVVDPDAETTTNDAGGKQSHVPVRFDLIDARALFEQAKVLHEGAEKYGANNWRRIPVEDHLNHLIMHAYAYLSGDRTDEHLSHIMCRATFAQGVAIEDGEALLDHMMDGIDE